MHWRKLLEPKACRTFLADKRENPLTHSREKSVVQFGRHKDKTYKHTHTHTHTITITDTNTQIQTSTKKNIR